jgi:hypothetical protein
MNEPKELDRDGQAPEEKRPEPEKQNSGKGHSPLKGTDTPATTDLEYAEREKGKRTTM